MMNLRIWVADCEGNRRYYSRTDAKKESLAEPVTALHRHVPLNS
jgi:hypothetical protein